MPFIYMYVHVQCIFSTCIFFTHLTEVDLRASVQSSVGDITDLVNHGGSHGNSAPSHHRESYSAK